MLCGENKLAVFKEGKVSGITEQRGRGRACWGWVEPGAGQQGTLLKHTELCKPD